MMKNASGLRLLGLLPAWGGSWTRSGRYRGLCRALLASGQRTIDKNADQRDNHSCRDHSSGPVVAEVDQPAADADGGGSGPENCVDREYPEAMMAVNSGAGGSPLGDSRASEVCAAWGSVASGGKLGWPAFSGRFFAFDTSGSLRMFAGELIYRARDICTGHQPVGVHGEIISQLRRRR
jgi:hypothetical protein